MQSSSEAVNAVKQSNSQCSEAVNAVNAVKQSNSQCGEAVNAVNAVRSEKCLPAAGRKSEKLLFVIA